MSMSAAETQFVYDQINKMGRQLQEQFNAWAKHEYAKRKQIEAELAQLRADYYNQQVPDVFLGQDINFEPPFEGGDDKGGE